MHYWLHRCDEIIVASKPLDHSQWIISLWGMTNGTNLHVLWVMYAIVDNVCFSQLFMCTCTCILYVSVIYSENIYCFYNNNYYDVIKICLSTARTCAEAGKEPGCCTGGPQNCSITANGKTCYCDSLCVVFNNCCSDVPTMCGMQ